MSAPVAPRIEVVRVTPAIADALADFFRAAWGDAGTAEDVRRGLADAAATNPVEQGADVPAVAFMRDGVILGYLGTIPVKFWNGATEVAAHWLKGFMVLPEHRNGPVGFTVLKELLRHIGASGILTVAPAARRLFTAVGYVDCGALPNYIAVLRPARVARNVDIAQLGLGLPPWTARAGRFAQRVGLASFAGAVAGAMLRTARAVRTPAGAFTTDAIATLPRAEQIDDLWHRSRETFTAAAVRDAAMLAWRYAPGPGATYEAVSVRGRPGVLEAIAIVRRPRDATDPRLRGIKVATLSDILFPASAPAAGVAVIVAAERAARRMGADALLCTANHPALTMALGRRAFLRLPANVHLLVRDPQRLAGLSTALASWWVTRGDAQSDEVF